MKRAAEHSDVGVRDLKTHASEMVRRVAEQRATYVVTLRGRPVGLLTPVPAPVSSAPENGADTWDRLDVLGKALNLAWKSDQTSTALVAEMRR